MGCIDGVIFNCDSFGRRPNVNAVIISAFYGVACNNDMRIVVRISTRSLYINTISRIAAITSYSIVSNLIVGHFILGIT